MCSLRSLRLFPRHCQTILKSGSNQTQYLSNYFRRISTHNSSHTNATSSQTHSTIDPEELSKFSSQAADWWHPNGSASALHRLNPVRVAYIRSAIEKHCSSSQHESPPNTIRRPLAGFEVLDVGCGGGLVSESIARLGSRVLGIDMNTASIAVAEQHKTTDPELSQGSQLVYKQAATEHIISTDVKFDAVLALEIIEHVSNPTTFLTQCADLVKPGGVFILSTINRTFASYALAIIAAERILRWLPTGTHDWSRFLTPNEISNLLSSHTTLQTVDLIGTTYNPLSATFSLSSDSSVNYMLTAKKPLIPE